MSIFCFLCGVSAGIAAVMAGIDGDMTKSVLFLNLGFLNFIYGRLYGVELVLLKIKANGKEAT